MGVLVRVSLVGVSQLGLLSLDHKDVKFLLVTQAEVTALAAVRTLDATVSIASMNLELANYYSICFRNLQVLFQLLSLVWEVKSFLRVWTLWVKGREWLGGEDRLTDTEKLIVQLNAIWKAKSSRISA